MAGVSSKEIRQRIRSMASTRQITKAMEMVAASKLRKAQTRITSARPYFQTLQDTIGQIAAGGADVSCAYLQRRPTEKKAYIVIAGDRGLAGGYNSNLLKRAIAEMDGQTAVVLPMGKKALEFFTARKIPVMTNRYAGAEDISVGDCFSIAKQLCDGYLRGEFDALSIVYTQFVSVLSQEPASLAVLPLQPAAAASKAEVLYEPDPETVLNTIVPEFVGGLLYGALCESRAAEQAARRSAMDAATQNADEMINSLNLKYNQVRQAAITQEITEIIAGA